MADAVSSTSGFANGSQGGASNLTRISFMVSGAGSRLESVGRNAVSVVEVGSPAVLRVTHDYHPSVSPHLYEATVTIKNISASSVQPRYRRVLDFDAEPTAFSEFITLEPGDAVRLLDSADDGFATADPLGGGFSDLASCGPAPFADCGPADHDAAFDFGFPVFSPGASVTFKAYFGAAGTEKEAFAALAAVEAEVFALVQPDGDPSGGTPNTFIVGFSGAGGSPYVPQCSLTPVAGGGPVNQNHTITATVTLAGAPLPGVTMEFDVVSGPHTGANSSTVTNDSGQALFIYGGSVTGLDRIEAVGNLIGLYPAFCKAGKGWNP